MEPAYSRYYPPSKCPLDSAESPGLATVMGCGDRGGRAGLAPDPYLLGSQTASPAVRV